MYSKSCIVLLLLILVTTSSGKTNGPGFVWCAAINLMKKKISDVSSVKEARQQHIDLTLP